MSKNAKITVYQGCFISPKGAAFSQILSYVQVFRYQHWVVIAIHFVHGEDGVVSHTFKSCLNTILLSVQMDSPKTTFS